MSSDSTDGGIAGCVRIAAAGDVHVGEATRPQSEAAFMGLAGQADLLLLAGDLTNHGEPEAAQVLVDACRPLEMPIFAVLGNHDWHSNRTEELVSVLAEGGITVLQREAATCHAAGLEVGVVGVKGFVGGFPGSHLPDFGEPLLRRVYAEMSADVEGVERGLEEIRDADVRIVLLHYSPVEETLEGEPPGIHAFLGCDRLAPPIARHRPDLVVHGHAHAGRLEGAIDGVPVYNVSVPVMQRDFWVFELRGAERSEPADVTLDTA